MDYHIEVDRHHYSVPYQLVRELLDVRITDSIVEILNKNQRVASHVRSYEQGEQTTLIVHMPKSHQKYLEWTPSRLLSWAEKNGTNTNRLFKKIMKKKTHTEQAFRSCLGIMRLEKRLHGRTPGSGMYACFFLSNHSPIKALNRSLKMDSISSPTPLERFG